MSDEATTPDITVLPPPEPAQEAPQDGVQTIEFPVDTETPDEPHRRGGGPIPREEKAAIHEAMERHNGDRAAAAADLGVPIEQLARQLSASPDLSARWTLRTDRPVPDEMDAMLSEQPLTTQQEKLAEIAAAEDAKMRKGLEKIGLTERQVEMGLALQSMARSSATGLMEISTGGMVKTTLILQEQLEEVTFRLSFVRQQINRLEGTQNMERIAWVEEEARLHEMLLMNADVMRKIQAEATRSAALLATVNYRVGSVKMKKAKPAFQDIGV